MSNAFYTFVNFFVSGTTVKAKPLNEQFQAVQAGFDNVENNAKAALKIAGYSSFAQITATPLSFLMLDSSGVPYASATVPFSPNFGGNRVQNIGTATVSTDAPNLGQVQTLINTAAYGSPTVMSVPALAGNALKALRVNAGATATEWADYMPAPPSEPSQQLYSSGSTWTAARDNPNMLMGGGLTLEGSSQVGWVNNYPASLSIWDLGNGVHEVIHEAGGFLAGNELFYSSNTYAPPATAGSTYTVSFDVATDQANKVNCSIVFLSAAYAVLSTTSVNASAYADRVVRRNSVTATAPASTAFVRVSVTASATISPTMYMSFRRFKCEVGSVATAFNDSRTLGMLNLFTQAFIIGLSGGSVNINIGNPSLYSTGHTTKISTGPLGTTYGVKLDAPPSFVAQDGMGDYNVQCRYMQLGNAAGYAQVVANGNTGAAKTIDFSAGAKQSATLNNNATVTLTAPPGTIVLDGLKLILKQDATGGRTVTFTSSATIKWAGGTAPVAQVAANSETMVNLFWDGTRFIGSWYEL